MVDLKAASGLSFSTRRTPCVRVIVRSPSGQECWSEWGRGSTDQSVRPASIAGYPGGPGPASITAKGTQSGRVDCRGVPGAGRCPLTSSPEVHMNTRSSDSQLEVDHFTADIHVRVPAEDRMGSTAVRPWVSMSLDSSRRLLWCEVSVERPSTVYSLPMDSRKPWMKGRLERLFGRLARDISLLPCGDARALTLGEFEAWVMDWVAQNRQYWEG